MKELILSYEDTEQLKVVIMDTYFNDGNLGKKSEDTNRPLLTVDKNETLYKTLHGMDYDKVKIKNFKILGTLICDVINNNDNSISLRPSSEVCVKEHKKYTFY